VQVVVEIDTVVEVLEEGASAVEVEDVSEDVVIVEVSEDSAARVGAGPLAVPFGSRSLHHPFARPTNTTAQRSPRPMPFTPKSGRITSESMASGWWF
jgi:hypothetical protein